MLEEAGDEYSALVNPPKLERDELWLMTRQKKGECTSKATGEVAAKIVGKIGFFSLHKVISVGRFI